MLEFKKVFHTNNINLIEDYLEILKIKGIKEPEIGVYKDVLLRRIKVNALRVARRQAARKAAI